MDRPVEISIIWKPCVASSHSHIATKTKTEKAGEMFPVIGTPKCVAFRSKLTGKYLQSLHEGSEQRAGRGGSKSFFEEVSGAAATAAVEGKEEEDDNDDVHVLASPYTRFYLEPSKEHDGLLHVRCCHNNTYWVAKHGGDGGGHWTIGIVNEPDGDVSRPSCTLFEPVPLTDVDNNLSVRFLRPQQTPTSESAGRAEETANEAYLHLETEGHADQKRSLHEFLVLELSQMVLPKHVLFKGDNKMYLRARLKPFPNPILGNNHLEFAGSDITDPTASHTIFPEHVGGIVRIKSDHFNRYWRRSSDSPDWIWASSSFPRQPDARFKVVPVWDYFALQNLGNHRYCKRLTDGRTTSCLSAAADTITLEARLYVEEAVLERQIDNVTFRLRDANIYGETPLSIPRVTATNSNSDPGKLTLAREYTVTESRSYTATVGLKIGIEVNFRAGIPIIADGQVTVSTEVSTEHTWGKTTQQTKTVKTEYEAVVPSMTMVTLTSAATQGYVSVPFSYRQRDVLTTGKVVEDMHDDGLFTGVNSYNFHFETTEERL